MNHSNEPDFAKRDGEAVRAQRDVDEAPDRPELRVLETRLRNARDAEIKGALEELKTTPSEAEGVEAQQFVASLREQWLESIREPRLEEVRASKNAFPTAQPMSAAATGQTALLAQGDGARAASRTAANQRWLPVAAAAAVVLAWAGWSSQETLQDQALPASQSTSQVDPSTPVYLGASSEEATGKAPNIAADGSVTVPPLPKVLDLSAHAGPMDSYRLVIHNVMKTSRLDDGKPYDEITYGPTWTCPDETRAQLPLLMRLEVHRPYGVRGAAPLWSRVFSRP